MVQGIFYASDQNDQIGRIFAQTLFMEVIASKNRTKMKLFFPFWSVVGTKTFWSILVCLFYNGTISFSASVSPLTT